MKPGAAILAGLAFMAPAAAGAGGADAPAGLAWEPGIVIASGAGEKGPWRQNDSRYDYVDDASVAFGAGGALAVAWADQKRKDVFIQQLADGVPAGPPVNVSRSPATFSWQPRIAVSQSDPATVYLLWQEIIFSGGSHGGDILFARLTDGGKQFGEALNLSRSRGGDGKGRLDRETWSNGSHDLAVAANGDVLAAWTEYHGALWFARSGDGGASFTAPRRVAGDDAAPARAPSLATGPGGVVYLAWSACCGAAPGIYLARSGEGGAGFSPPRRIKAGPGHLDAPRLAVDGQGQVHLVYAEAPSRRGGRYRVRHVRAPAGLERFSAPRTLSAGGAGSAAYAAIATDGRDGIFVIWEVLPRGAARPQALHIAASSDGGASFTAPAPVPGSSAGPAAGNGSHQGLLGKKLAVDGAGRLAIVNSSMAPGERSRVWLMRGQAALQRPLAPATPAGR